MQRLERQPLLSPSKTHERPLTLGVCRKVEEEAELESDHKDSGRDERDEPQVSNEHMKVLRRRKERQKKEKAAAHG